MERSVSQLGTKDFFLTQAKTLRLSDERSSGEVLVAWAHSVENTFLQFFILPEVRRRIQNRRFEHFLFFFFAAWSLTEGCFLLSKQPRLELSIAASSLKIVKQTTSEAVITRSDQNQSVGLKATLLPILCSRNLHFPPSIFYCTGPQMHEYTPSLTHTRAHMHTQA